MPSRPPPKTSRPTGSTHAGTTGPKRGAPSAPLGRPGPAGSAQHDRAVLAAALDPIITIDSRGMIQTASDSVHRVLGWTPAELIGRNVSTLMPEPHHSAHDGYLANYHNTGRTNILNRPRRFEAIKKDGVLVPIELCVSRAEIPGGGEPLFVGIIRDMSAYAAAERSRDEERIRSQQLLAEQTSALQQAHLRLRMADRMASIGTLAAGLGHDMNNVLLPVRARLNALRAAGEAGTLPADELRHVHEIHKSIAYLQQLADGLHFLALDPETEEADRGGGATTNLKRWWSQAGAILAKAVPKHVRISASFPAGLPDAGIAAHGLTQAALNLVVNAGEAIPPPSVRKRPVGRVRVWAESWGDQGSWIRLSVTDNGLGMTDEVKRRAAEMFFTTKPRGLGTGLGLALVRRVTERAGGHIDIESQPGAGTTVSLVLPTSGAHAAERPGSIGAVVSIADGRAAALVRSILENSGARVLPEGDAGKAQIWVIGPRDADPATLKAWKGKQTAAQVVRLGGTPAPSLRPLHPIIIEDPDDFESIRNAITSAIAAARRGARTRVQAAR